jgi:hypothetical protein
MAVIRLGYVTPAVWLAACAGPWAQPTHVILAPMHGSKMSGQAEVLEAATPGLHGSRAVGGSEIIVIVDSQAPLVSYEASLATGSCGAPTDQHPITQFIGPDGGQAHVEMPVVPLTSGKYIIIVRQVGASGKSSSCGVIRRGWPW